MNYLDYFFVRHDSIEIKGLAFSYYHFF